jgi:hypothetical protein
MVRVTVVVGAPAVIVVGLNSHPAPDPPPVSAGRFEHATLTAELNDPPAGTAENA